MADNLTLIAASILFGLAIGLHLRTRRQRERLRLQAKALEEWQAILDQQEKSIKAQLVWGQMDAHLTEQGIELSRTGLRYSVGDVEMVSTIWGKN